MKIEGFKKILVLGGGESGVGAALLAAKNEYDVFLSDAGELSTEHREELKKFKVPFEEKGHTLDKIESFDLIIKSPGVPGHVPPLQIAKVNGIRVISEIEFGYHFYTGRIIGITGSNGKTTTSGLLFQLLKHAGIDVEIGGNYGVSFCRLLANADRITEYIVLELSSFQLDDVADFRPNIGILLNVTPDHLDRYEYDVMKYGRAKMKITTNQNAEDLFIYNEDDEITTKLLSETSIKAKLLPITKNEYEDGIYSKELDLKFDIKLYGKHNLFNAMCAIQASRYLGITDLTIGEGLKLFTNVPHRMESVAVIDEIKFINDSKATNVDAVFYALDGIDAKIIWIAGGTDKGNDYSALFRLVEEKVHTLICLGIDNGKLIDAFHFKVDHLESTRNVIEAVQMAKNMAKPGEVVILSPACASFDLFKNYEDRGNQFKEAVWNLIE